MMVVLMVGEVLLLWLRLMACRTKPGHGVRGARMEGVFKLLSRWW